MNDEQIIKLFHDLKNDFAAMSALTNLHRIYTEKLTSAELIDRIQERQLVIATAYEQLHQNRNYPFINMKRCMEELLLREGRTLYACDSNIRLEKDIDDYELPLKTILPLIQIAVELITNSYRHAFAGHEGEKIIKLSILKTDSGFRLDYSDNGRGLPPDLNPMKARSLGMQFIRSLSKQLGSKSEFIDNGKGMAFTLELDD